MFNSLSPLVSQTQQSVGIGLRDPYYQEVLDTELELGFLEVHPENYFGGGQNRHFLSKAREQYPLSLHAVGLSLGSVEAVCDRHLQKIKELIDIFEPFVVSDHASWSATGNAHLNDLLPLPYNDETLSILCRNVEKTQTFFGRQILVENPSTYVAFNHNTMTEYEFMNAVAERTGCGILLDINNIYVQAVNHNMNPEEYIDRIDPDYVGEMHLAGHIEQETESNRVILVDSHSRPVRDEVWALYQRAVSRFGAVPTIIEWDQDFPTLEVLVSEAEKARAIVRETVTENKADVLGDVLAEERHAYAN